MKFKVGDKVKRIAGKDYDGVKLGGVYTIEDVGKSGEISIGVGNYIEDNFELVEAAQPSTTLDPQSSYYGVGGIEVLDVIKAKLTPEQYKGYLLGNIIKYSGRCNYKGTMSRDVEKCANYSKWLSEEIADERLRKLEGE